MFSAFTSYLWGSEERAEELPSISVEEISDVDGDWIFVKSSPYEGNEESIGQADESDFIITDDMKSDCSDHSGPGMEESWFVTPPPCFTGEKNRMLEGHNVSRLENLLIEHPSMSVYEPRACSSLTHQKAKRAPKFNEKIEKENTDASEVSPPVNMMIQPATKPNGVAQPSKRLKSLEERKPFTEVNVCRGEIVSKKSTKKSNLVHNRQAKSKRHRKQGLKAGKHVGMAGKRGT